MVAIGDLNGNFTGNEELPIEKSKFASFQASFQLYCEEKKFWAFLTKDAPSMPVSPDISSTASKNDLYKNNSLFVKDMQDWKANMASAWKVLENITRTRHRNLILKYRGTETKMAEPYKAWTDIKGHYVKESPSLQFNDIKADLNAINIETSGDIEVDIGRIEVAVLELANAATQIGNAIDQSEQIFAYITR
jgi:hypothetical protein